MKQHELTLEQKISLTNDNSHFGAKEIENLSEVDTSV